MEATLNRKARRKSKQPRVRLSWAAKLHYLKSEAAIKSLPANKRRMLIAECKSMEKRFINEACSSVWYEDLWTHPSRRNDWIPVKDYDIEYPPPAENTPMRRCRCPLCRNAGRFWPAHYIGAGGLSFDCWLDRCKYSHRIPGTIGNVVRKADL
jgi:hypothetical protein